MKRGLIENLDGFLKLTKKIVKKKRRLANAFKQKFNIDKQNYKTVVIKTFDNLNKKELLTLILAPIFEKIVKVIIRIDTNIYCLACQFN